ncbi:hypothetical protein VFPFJ_00841 [Purpureocillium lilacinum]|uniref:Uncharacterized protein n=1 Tax=Purpureocillium lilacinum TaxID=33203 RepID=A0A179H9G7_PURLI|nr:hypothetical protein VFPFJ_00841 [Purpureocillium lilacinum]OAQ86767.1 hypothetical protein VFPBJ_00807 [Purpureocillium lilacinum]OAQ94732.1 hypothetical protein VFPFJ_00841 [Purpureocillium lilacinum]
MSLRRRYWRAARTALHKACWFPSSWKFPDIWTSHGSGDRERHRWAGRAWSTRSRNPRAVCQLLAPLPRCWHLGIVMLADAGRVDLPCGRAGLCKLDA